MLSTNKLKKIKSNFPVLVGDNVVSKNICNLLIKEISKSKSFDDMIMGGRSRINKGSKNFNLYIKNSISPFRLKFVNILKAPGKLKPTIITLSIK